MHTRTTTIPPDAEHFLTREEVADLLHVTADTVSGYVVQGRLRGVRLGRRLLVPVSALAELARP